MALIFMALETSFHFAVKTVAQMHRFASKRDLTPSLHPPDS